MPRTPRKPGFWFWLWTFTLGAFSEEKGKHRINTKMQELNSCIRVQESDILRLRKERDALARDNVRLRKALHLDAAVNRRTPSWSRESTDDEVDTLSIPVVSTN